ncbi:1-aminocyclopropane-1-carboxylate deaminase/D-cysteine desulfhydrase [Flavimarina sp. Hel_I_48]|uniref:1-aminocyclopropane-1-carboxylate deaminase/D-cysteine desulfhydrase n=1 Tax=Flavimarina sp. Hel_I_48 TaxID=1392488 RepID=UPI0004DF8B09|nr:pyridoxal-phosphate dependent enzyme [Flavimarina sp. Hel_I_48]
MNIFDQHLDSKNQFLFKDSATGIRLTVKREDQLDAAVSGNKFRKLKYNIAEAKANGFKTLLTYGGAFSNHIAATAKAGKITGLKTVGIIRGDELGADLQKTFSQNATLRLADACGMQLKFISRGQYREKGTPCFRESVLTDFEDFYELPEGGTNALAIKGCKEILNAEDKDYDYICCPAGTGGTAAGIIEASEKHQQILVFSALKGDFLKEEIARFTTKQNWSLITDYHCGGYARVSSDLITFINESKKTYKIQLDPIYTGKMFYGIHEMIRSGYFSKNTRILAVHTGGLQGIPGINARLKKQGSKLIDYEN